jgi:mercuric ion transport protein
MKKLWILMAILALFACNSQPKTGSGQAEEAVANADADWVEVVLNVKGMTCEGCENAIKASVETLDGIASVESSFEEAWTKVKFDKGVTSVEEISEKITDTGYQVVGEKEAGTP